MRQNEPFGNDTAQFVCWVKTKFCTSPQTHHLPPEAWWGDLLPVKTRMPNIQQTHREGSQSAEWVATSTQAPSPIETRNVLFTPDPQGTSETLSYFESGGKNCDVFRCKDACWRSRPTFSFQEDFKVGFGFLVFSTYATEYKCRWFWASEIPNMLWSHILNECKEGLTLYP